MADWKSSERSQSGCEGWSTRLGWALALALAALGLGWATPEDAAPPTWWAQWWSFDETSIV